jgi:asparagine synthase (glutamine-hydrolysing)
VFALNRFCGRVGTGGLEVSVHERDDRAAVHAGCAVLLRGFIANEAALRDELGLPGGVDGCEPAIAAHAYRRWGAAVQQRLLGEYAIVLYDPRERSALITHDALGLAPLFYRELPGELLFATHLLDMIALLDDDELDAEYFADYLATGYVTGARTPFRSVKRLLPGMTLCWSPAGATLRRTWDLAAVGTMPRLPAAEYEARLLELLTEGVRSSLDRQGPTWISLSGGLDSSTIACLAARQGDARIGAFSLIVPDFPDANEEEWMREVVRECGIPWYPLDVGTALPFSEPPDGFLGEPSPGIFHAAVRKKRNALLAQHGVKTVLTGDGGDAILGTFPGPVPTHLADPLFAGDFVSAIRGVRDWSAATGNTRSQSFWFSRALLMPAYSHLRGRQIKSDAPLPSPPWLDEGYARRMRLGERNRRGVATRCSAPGAQHVWDTIWMGSLSMALSASTLEGHVVRTPLLYRPLVEFMQGVPWEQKLRPRCDRYLQRRALKGVLPERIRRRDGKAIGTWPFVEGLRRSRSWMELLSDDPRIVSLGITSPQAWRDGVRQAAVGQTFGDRYFLTAAAFETWLQGLEAWRRTNRANAAVRPTELSLVSAGGAGGAAG